MLEHVIEFRARALRCLLWFLLCFALCFYFANALYLIVVDPLIERLSKPAHMIATNVTSSVFTPMHLAVRLSFLFTVPMILWQLWGFVAPGLYNREQRPIRCFLLAGLFLFGLGVAFAYYVALPLLFSFFIHAVPQSVVLLPDIRQTLDFTLSTLTLFGLGFEVPLVCLGLVRFGVVSPSQLVALRPYVIVLAFIVGMILTPPDVVSQLMLAIPLCLLYEIGIVWAKIQRLS